MKWKDDLKALIDSTMAFAREKQIDIPAPVALDMAELVLAETPRPMEIISSIPPIVAPRSERDDILDRVNNFRAHQAKVAQEREGHYLELKARLFTPAATESPSQKPLA